MSDCESCGMRLDECNESQPVCPCCGEAAYPTGFFCQHTNRELEDSWRLTPLSKQLTRTAGNPDEFRQAFRNDPRGIRYVPALHGVCLRCGAVANGTSYRGCSNFQCGESWRVNRCRICKEPVDSRDPETPRVRSADGSSARPATLAIVPESDRLPARQHFVLDT